ncbi:hypothetical protein STXM2123_1453 [Streptomyces sp. F-3]|nr:hypothetical protein STXM2123_1453 [Streptomyces sp. F-3]
MHLVHGDARLPSHSSPAPVVAPEPHSSIAPAGRRRMSPDGGTEAPGGTKDGGDAPAGLPGDPLAQLAERTTGPGALP